MSLLGIASCFGPVGPIVGDWRDEEPSRAVSLETNIEIILDGLPGATEGTYHYSSLITGEQIDFESREVRWSDRWHMRPITVDGQAMRLVHLDRLVGSNLRDFILTPQNILVPQVNPNRPDLSRNTYLVALYPVPRNTYGYGRP